ncbi:hypothetical protein Csa_008746 [Cucumis sativus]|uniref:Uncharacterized protein n=1 Tax=Cucumis sativus TaxID=3659 RepID=A0A0A0KR07_CUCSA|nr:hypothetical protein Csa_008746 [Cucumis sativus]
MPSSSSQTSIPIFILLLLLLLLSGLSSATRPGKTMEFTEMNPDMSNSYKTAFRYGGQTFSFLPKGVPIPPSGPSDRHNSVVDSLPPN